MILNSASLLNAQEVIHLEPVDTLTNKVNLSLYQIGDISLIGKNKIMVSDKLVYKVYLFNQQGSKLTQAGARGKGPDEFSTAPANITFDKRNKKLAVLDLTTSSLNIYDSELNFVDRIISQYPPSDIIYDGNGNLLIGIPPTGSHHDSIIIYNANNEFSTSFDLKLDFKNLIFDIFYTDYLNSTNQIIVVYQYRNLIQFYSRNGKLVKEIVIPGLPKLSNSVKRNTGRIKELPSNNMFKSITTNEEYVYVLGGFYTEVPDRTVYKISNQGKVLKKLVLKEDTDIITAKNGYLFTANTATITKYKLED